MDTDSLALVVAREIVQAAAPLLATLLVALVGMALRKFNLQIGAEKQARIEKFVQDEILRQEEYAAQLLKKGVTAVASHTKLANVTERILDRFPGITPQEATALVHQELPKLGLGAASFMGAVRQAATNAQR